MSDLYDAYGESKYYRVMDDTWSHLKPKNNRAYPGYIVFSHAEDGLICLLARDFKGLEGSPWEYEAINGFIDTLTNLPEVERGEVYRWEGIMRNYKFKGHLIHVPTKVDPKQVRAKKDDPVYGVNYA